MSSTILPMHRRVSKTIPKPVLRRSMDLAYEILSAAAPLSRDRDPLFCVDGAARSPLRNATHNSFVQPPWTTGIPAALDRGHDSPSNLVKQPTASSNTIEPWTNRSVRRGTEQLIKKEGKQCSCLVSAAHGVDDDVKESDGISSRMNSSQCHSADTPQKRVEHAINGVDSSASDTDPKPTHEGAPSTSISFSDYSHETNDDAFTQPLGVGAEKTETAKKSGGRNVAADALLFQIGERPASPK